MVDGLTPHIVYYPVAALAALTAALVTLIVAVNAWRRSARIGQPLHRDNRRQLQNETSISRSPRRKRTNHESLTNDITEDILLTEIPNDPYEGQCPPESISDGRESPWMQNSISSTKGESEILSAYMNKLETKWDLDGERGSISLKSTPSKIFHGSTDLDIQVMKYRTMDRSFGYVKNDLHTSHSLSSIISSFNNVPFIKEPPIPRCNSAGDGIFRRSNKSRSSPIFDICSRSRMNLGHSHIVNEANIEFSNLHSNNPSVENVLYPGDSEEPVLSVVIDEDKQSQENTMNLRITLKEQMNGNNEAENRNFMNTGRKSAVSLKLPIQQTEAISDSDLESRATPDRVGLPEQSDANAVPQRQFDNTQDLPKYRLRFHENQGIYTTSGNVSDEEESKTSGKCNSLTRSLDSVFFLYDTTISENNRSRYVIRDDSLLSKININAIAEPTFSTDKTPAVSEMNKKRDSLQELKTDISFKQLIPVKFDPVNFRPQNLRNFPPDSISNENGKRTVESTATEVVAVKKCDGVFVGVGEGDERRTDCLQRQYLEAMSGRNAEGEQVTEKNPLFVEAGDKAGDLSVSAEKFISRSSAKEDNGEEGHYSCFLSGDVTSSAVHAGKGVQGSSREELIACSGSHIVTEKPSQGVFQSPAYDGRKMQMAKAINNSCNDHDLDTKREASDPAAADRLDELLHHLRAIAGTDDTLAANAGNQRNSSATTASRSTVKKLSVGLLSEYYSDTHPEICSAFSPLDNSSSEYSNYASDDSQSIGLSSVDGDSIRSSSSCVNSSLDSPKCSRKQLHSILRKENDILDTLDREYSNSAIISGSAFQFGGQAFDDERRGYVNSSNVNAASENFTKNASTYRTLNSKILQCAIKEITESMESLSEDRSQNAKEDYSRQVRLRNLMERDRLRQENRKFTLADKGEEQSSMHNEDQKHTLDAMETAIGHMQQLVEQGRRIEQRHSADHELHNKQYFTIHERKTIELENNTEVRRYNLLSFDSGMSSEEVTFNESPSICEFADNLNLKETTPDINYVENSEKKTITAIDNDFFVDSLPSSESVTSNSTDRWRNDCNLLPSSEKYEEVILNSDVKRDLPTAKSFEVNRSAFDELSSRLSDSCCCDENVGEKFKSETELLLHRGAFGDVTDSVGQLEALRLGEGRADRKAVASRTPFSDALRISKGLGMESGGCEAEKVTSPPPAQTANAATNTAPTPTKVKNLRFKLDPDVYNLPSENGYYPEDEDYDCRPGWRKQPKYQTFSSLELGRSREPVKVVSVRTSVVPAGTKMVVKPVCVSEGQPSGKGQKSGDPKVTVKSLDIDLRIRLETQEEENKTGKKIEQIVDVVRGDWRASPDRQIKKRPPIPDFSGWNQSLSPVSENCDWNAVPSTSPDEVVLSTSSDPGQSKRVFHLDNSSKFSTFNDFTDEGELCEKEIIIPFKENGGDFSQSPERVRNTSDSESNNLVTSTPARPVTLELNHFRKYLQLPRKKFVPDPDAVERITGFKAAEETASTKPPLPPSIRSLPNSHRMSSGAKNRIDQLRKKYLDSKALMAAQKVDSSVKFEQFLNSAQEDRAKIANSAPDLAAFEAAVRKQWSKVRSESNSSSGTKENSPPEFTGSTTSSVRSSTPDDAWMNYVQQLRRQLNRRSQSMTYLETDVDAFFSEDKCQSMTTLEDSPPNSTQSLFLPTTKSKRISMHLEESDRTKSEHELRVEKSLQNLSVPEWYKHSQRPKVGFILNRKSNEKRGWAAAKSLTSSTTSLASAGNKSRCPARSLRTSHENLLWSRGSASPASADNSYGRYTKSATNAPVLSLALAKAFREPYVGWRARTPSSCTSASPQVDLSPPSWVVMDNTDRSDTPLTSDLQAMDEEEDTGMSFDGEDVIEEPGSSDIQEAGKPKNRDSPLPSADDTCDDIINISMDTCDQQLERRENSKSGDLPGEDTCDDIKNITMDTFELFPPNINEDHKTSPIGDDTCDDILNISTDTSSHLNPIVNGNQCTSSIMGATEDTGVDIDDISTDTSNIVLSQPLVNGKHENSSVFYEGNKISNGDGNTQDSLCRNMNETDPSSNSNINEESLNRIPHGINGNGNSQIEDREFINCNHKVLFTVENEHHLNGNGNNQYHLDRSHELEQNRLDPKRKRYSYNRSIYHSEFDGVKNRISVTHKNHLDGSTQSLPGDKNSGDNDKVIWIESSFVGSRTTTSIVVMPTDASKDVCKGNTGSNTSVGRPASR